MGSPSTLPRTKDRRAAAKVGVLREQAVAIIKGGECGRTVSRLAAVRPAWGLPPLTRRDLLLKLAAAGIAVTSPALALADEQPNRFERSDAKHEGTPPGLQLQGNIWPVHDPCIIKANGLYHLFSTSQLAEQKGLIHWRTSPDLITWSFKGPVMLVFPDWVTQAVPEIQGAWAPDISYENGQYRLYYAVSTFGTNASAIGLMTTPTLDTSRADFAWKDAGLVIQSRDTDDYNAIDPNLVVDASGGQWLVLGSFWSGLKMTALDPVSRKPKDIKALISLAQRVVGKPGAVEAAFLIRRGGEYYLFASYDYCCRGVNSTYYTVVGRSKSVQGPFKDRAGKSLLQGGGTVVLSASDRWKGPGHCAVLQDAGWTTSSITPMTPKTMAGIRCGSTGSTGATVGP
jgi:arabinan endo-1,5-alpha-L-arabinosidase